MIIADTSGLLSFFNKAEPSHSAVLGVVERNEGTMIVSPFVLAELDYLIATRVGVDTELLVLAELAGGAYELAQFEAADLEQAKEVIERYRDQQIGLADASLVVLADRYETRRILTLDRRHFEALRPLQGGRFRIEP